VQRGAGRLVTAGLLAALVAGLPGCTDDGPLPGTSGPDLPGGSAPLTQATPESCGACHPQHHEEWQRSMHAYAGRDPVWFALNAAGQEDTGGGLGEFCVFCHAPAASLAGQTEPLVPGQAPVEVGHGVHCGFCHTVSSFDGISNQEHRFVMAEDDVVYGTIREPIDTPAHRSELRPELRTSEFCGTCHELVNDGDTAIETTYTEWVDSAFTAMGIGCQDCHMPTYRGRATPDGPERTLHRHTFVGVDVAMEDVPERAQQIRDVQALLESSARLTLLDSSAGDSLRIDARVENLGAGHALPSGPTMERQLWIELRVTDGDGTELFVSGDLDANGDLRDHHSEIDQGDTQLALFNTRLIDEHGDETPFMWRAVQVESRLIRAFGQRTVRYGIEVPPDVRWPLTVEATLRFRAIPPYTLRELALDHLAERVPVFEMTRATLNVPGTR
jgi:hypothetical protein